MLLFWQGLGIIRADKGIETVIMPYTFVTEQSHQLIILPQCPAKMEKTKVSPRKRGLASLLSMADLIK